jgi:hypothetical protein
MNKLEKINKIETALIKNDLSQLNDEERLSYYNNLCDSLGLNKLSQPFGYISLNGKLCLYAKKDCTDQLRKIYNVSVVITSRQKEDGLYTVTARAKTPDNREDESLGAVTIINLKGDQLANALMKCETKAKRRVTLSICGLGLLDEAEIETIPAAALEVKAQEPKIEEPKQVEQKKEIKNHADNIPATLGQFQKMKEFREILGLQINHIETACAFLFGLDNPRKMTVKNAEMILTALERSKSAEDFWLEIQKILD